MRNIDFKFRITGIFLYTALSVAIFISTYGDAQGAEKYPTRTVDIIVPFSPGASTDLLARFFAEQLSKRWGHTVNVVNKPGGQGIIGTLEVMNARPDGYTILMDGAPTSSAQIGAKGLPYDVLNRSFLANAASVPQVFLLAQNTPWNSLKELSTAGQKDPASIVWAAASGGRGGTDIFILQFFEAAGIDVPKTKRVDMTGSAAAINALAGGHVMIAGSSPSVVFPTVSAGKAKAIAISSENRFPSMPEVPTTREAGFPTMDYISWKGFSGPPGLAAEITEIFVRTVEEVLKDPEALALLQKRCESFATFMGPNDMKNFVINESVMIQKLLKVMTGNK